MKEEKVRRLDVLREYPECKKEEIVGFKAFYEEGRSAKIRSVL